MLGLARIKFACCYLPVDGVLSDWGEWGECSATCGVEGLRARSRTCQEPQYGGAECEGELEEHEPCGGLPSCPGD